MNVLLVLSIVFLALKVSSPIQAEVFLNGLSDNGTIIWSPLRPDDSYKTANTEPQKSHLGMFKSLSQVFINLTLPDILPSATISNLLNEDTGISGKVKQLMKDVAGYSAFIIIGVLFVILFPIGGLLFCCCRCCGKCGGRRSSKQRNNGRVWSTILTTFLLAFSIVVIIGVFGIFKTNTALTHNLERLNGSLSDAVDDLQTFVGNIKYQFNVIGSTNFNFLSATLTDYLNRTPDTLSQGIVDSVIQSGNMESLLDQLLLYQLQSLLIVAKLANLSYSFEMQRETAMQSMELLGSSKCLIPSCLLDINTAIREFDTSGINGTLADYRDFVEADVVQQMQSNINDKIESIIDDALIGINVQATLGGVYDRNIKNWLSQIDNLHIDIVEKTDNMQEQAVEVIEKVLAYDIYRKIGGLVLAAFLTLIVGLLIIAVLLGVLCHGTRSQFHEQSVASKIVSLLLIASVILIFITGPLLMLLTTLTYSAGSPLERYVCQSVGDWDKIETYVSASQLNFDLSNIQFAVYNRTIRTSLSDVMEGCRQKKTLYHLLRLEEVVNDAVGQIKEAQQDINITNYLSLSTIADKVGDVIDLFSELESLTNTSFYSSTLRFLLSDLQLELEQQRNLSEAILPESGTLFDDMTGTLTEMVALAEELEFLSGNISDVAFQLIFHMDAVRLTLSDGTIMTPIIRNATQSVMNHVTALVDSYIDDTISKLQTDVGICTPVYTVAKFILTDNLCHGIVDPLNGFWLALGWCVFFLVFTIILAMKLVKYYRVILDENDFDDDGTTNGSYQCFQMNSHTNKVMHQN